MERNFCLYYYLCTYVPVYFFPAHGWLPADASATPRVATGGSRGGRAKGGAPTPFDAGNARELFFDFGAFTFRANDLGDHRCDGNPLFKRGSAILADESEHGHGLVLLQRRCERGGHPFETGAGFFGDGDEGGVLDEVHHPDGVNKGDLAVIFFLGYGDVTGKQ